MRRRDENGMSLVEVVLALVILGAVFSALMAGLATTSKSSTYHRDLVTGDRVLRDYAEATKAAARTSCPSPGTYTVSYTPPSGFAVNSLGTLTCPAVTTTGAVALSVTLPNGTVKQLDLKVRTS